jgi:hypothetical protein
VRFRNGNVSCASVWSGEPVRREAPPLEDIVAGDEFCGRVGDGSVCCWSAADVAAASPGERVVGVSNAVELAAGDDHFCARLRDGHVRCWGADADGQLGVRPSWWLDHPVAVDVRQ